MNLDDDDRRRKMMRLNNSGGSLAQQLLDGAPGAIPLLYTVAPTRSALTPSFTRATTETGQKYDSAGYLDFTALAGEVIFKGAMRIRNLLSATQAMGAAPWAAVVTGIATVTPTDGQADPWGGTSATKLVFSTSNDGNVSVWREAVSVTSGNTHMSQLYIRADVPTTLYLRRGASASFVTLNVTTEWQALHGAAVVAASTTCNFDLTPKPDATTGTAGATVYVVGAQLSNTTGETDQTTLRPYVSVGVLSSPYQGAFVDGVQYFPYDLNGNAIPRTGSYPLVGYVPWEARTNHFKNSGTPATQTSASLGTGTYTLWMTGTGSIAVAGNTATITGAGTATAGTPVTFVVTVAGTVDYTVTGSPTKAQSENGAFPTPYIITAGAAVARNADLLTYTGASGYVAAAVTFSRGTGISSAGEIVALSDGTANEYNGISLTSATALKFDGVDGGVAQWATTASNAYTPTTNAKAAVSVATNAIKMDFNATAQTEDTGATTPTTTEVHVGHLNGAAVFNGPVTDLYFWTRNLSQSELGAVDR